MLGSAHYYEILIHERHLDTFGHVNNAMYLDLLEEARWDLITSNGFGLDTIQRLRVGPTILEINLRFLREIRNRQRIKIKSWLESYEGKVGRFSQQMINEREEVCCEAAFVMGLFDVQARKLIRPTPEWWTALGVSEAERPEQRGAL
jgi:thioesterase III